MWRRIKIKKNSIKIRLSTEVNGMQIFKSIISHPMETGYRFDKRTGRNVPADYINKFQINIDGELYVEMILGEFVSKNPFLSFTFTKPVVDNQRLNVSWVDNNGDKTIYDTIVIINSDGRFYFSEDKINSGIVKLLP